jgi:uncharacterized protein YjbI with pentapeptide repeats
MAQVNRRKMSLYDEAKAGLSSLLKQTAIVFLGLLVMLIVTGGSPPAFIMGLSVLTGVSFVAWSENRRLTEPEKADLERHPAISHNCIEYSSLTLGTESRLEQIISPNKEAVIQKCRQERAENTSKSLNSQEFLCLIQQIEEAQTDDFIELAKIAGLDPLKDFVRADLSNVNLSYANLRGINLSGANLSKANLSGANLSNANLSSTVLYFADLSGVVLSGANLSNAELSHAIILHGANLYDVNLSHANLNYADMRGAMVYGANLSSARLDGAKVEDSRFGWNKGLTEDLRRDLQLRGAIFKDSADDRAQISTPT